MQLQQLPGSVGESLRSPATEEARAQAMAEYSQRFVTHRLDASCLNVASSGQSSIVNAALTGGNPFQVIFCSAVRAGHHGDSVLVSREVCQTLPNAAHLCLTLSPSCTESTQISNAMQAQGLLRDWQAGPHLAKLAQPMLLLEGSSEELLPQSTANLQALRPGGTCTIETLEGAASYAHIDAWEPYLEAVNTFLNANDQQAI